MSREYGYSQGQAQEPMVWERVEWRQGDGRYVFEVAQGGLHATLSSPHGSKLILPMVAWEGLLDALAAARKTKARAERNLPSRTGARWSEVEMQELAKTFKAGGSIAQLARVHNRTQFAVETQLDRQGLWDRVERRPTARTIGGHPPASAPSDGSQQPVSALAGGRRSDAAQQPASSKPLDAPWSPAPAVGRRYDTGQQSPSGALDVRRPPAPGPAAIGRHHDTGELPPTVSGDEGRPSTPTPATGRRHDAGQ
jgi:hypothetical protein